MKFLISSFIITFLGLMVVTSAPSSANGPAGRITAKCTPGWTASPGWYTNAQLGSQPGVKYACSRNLPPNSDSPFTPNYPLVCSDRFSPLRENSGADAPHIEPSGKATYFCISEGPH